MEVERSEPGIIMLSRELFGVGMQKSPVQSQPSMQSPRLAFGPNPPDGAGAIYKPIASTSPPSPFQTGGGEGAAAAVPPLPHGLTINVGVGEPVMKRKRGRPRKYGPDGSMALALGHASPSPQGRMSHSGFSPSSAGMANPAASTSPDAAKKVRGRPPGSGRKLQMAALGKFSFLPFSACLQCR